MNQLKSVYNIQFLDSYSHLKHTRLSMIASNDTIYTTGSQKSQHSSDLPIS